MPSVADEEIVQQDLVLEIRPKWPHAPTSLPELQRLQIDFLEQSRLLVLHGYAGELQPRHLESLLDPGAEYTADGEPAANVLYIDVFCKPGVTDVEGEMAALALLHAGLPDIRCAAGTRYRLRGGVPLSRRSAVEQLIGNPIVHQFRWSDAVPNESVTAGNTNDSLWLHAGPVHTIDLTGDDGALLAYSRAHHLALDLVEMRAIAAYFEAQGRPPTDVELQSLALTWSEHCSHKTFKADIEFDGDGHSETIHGLLRTYFISPTDQLDRTWVRSAFTDNAGVIAFDRRHDLAFKVETHNHPAALEPFGGAHTGVGGVIRDILAVSAEPLANTDVLCFGPTDLPDEQLPAGALHPRTTYREVTRGVADYGNNMGIPTVGGAILFHPGYTANPLVYCGTLGLAPRAGHPCRPLPGDAVVVLGGRTGRDGLHGATMSSERLDRAGVAGSAVQIGAPMVEKGLRDVLPPLRDERLYHAVTDCGAGGLCSAVGEMGATLGVDVDLALVPLKYRGLSPWEIWLSEAQERLVLAVPPESRRRVSELCQAYGVEMSVIGRFRSDGMLQLRHGDRPVAELSMAFMHDGRPARTLPAYFQTTAPAPVMMPVSPGPQLALLALLSHPNIATKEEVIRRYDHEVGAATIIKPLVGRAGPSDATVLQPLPASWRGAVLSHGINPLYGMLDPHAMAMLVVDEALRNLVAVGGSIDRAALLDNFCWGDVDDPAELGALVRAAQGCRDAALRYGTPFISGKDSLRNTSQLDGEVHSIPGTLLISAVGVVPDVRRSVSMDLKAPGNALYLVGETGDELGGSHYVWIHGGSGGKVPEVREHTPNLMRHLTIALRRGLIRSCHDLSEGGLAVAAAEMALAGGLGVTFELDGVPSGTTSRAALLFAESPGRFLVEVAGEDTPSFERMLAGLPVGRIGTSTDAPRVIFTQGGDPVVDLTLTRIEQAWRRIPADAANLPVDRASVPAGAHGPISSSLTNHPGAKVQAMVLVAPGTNCDRETIEACQRAGARAETVRLKQVLSGERSLGDFGLLVLPGGFSYGDHLGAGALVATILRHGLLDDLQRFIADGRPVLGICNGFQILARLGLLGDVTLAANSSGRFECRWVRLRVEDSPCLFLSGLTELELPVAHGQGRVMIAGAATCLDGSRAPLRYVDNPNGSTGDIAGICNSAGNVFGLMPHPERFLTPYHHPHRPRERPEMPLGLALFHNAVQAVRREL